MTGNRFPNGALIGALILSATVAACGSRADARQGGGPSRALVEQLVESYSGGQSPTQRYQFSDVAVAPPRVLQIGEVYGLKGGTKVWPARTTYNVYTAAGDTTASWSTCESYHHVDYWYIYKDEFGKWAEYAASHSGTVSRNTYHGSCPNMPGVVIFSTPMASKP